MRYKYKTQHSIVTQHKKALILQLHSHWIKSLTKLFLVVSQLLFAQDELDLSINVVMSFNNLTPT